MGCDGMEEMRYSLLLADPYGLFPLSQMYVSNQFVNYAFGVVFSMKLALLCLGASCAIAA